MRYIKTFEGKEEMSKKEMRYEIRDLKRKIKEVTEIKKNHEKHIKKTEEDLKECDRLIDLWTKDISWYEKQLKN
jgi:peptidoglycan hydrolase CwlO-like protein